MLTRVVKPGGNLYLLVYATEGLRWPLIEWLRPSVEQVGAAFDELAGGSTARLSADPDLLADLTGLRRIGHVDAQSEGTAARALDVRASAVQPVAAARQCRNLPATTREGGGDSAARLAAR